MVADLFIWEELARPERWEALAGLLDRLPEMYRKARERFEVDYESNEVIRFFLRDQLQEMDEAPLLASLGVSSREEATPERFVQRLELRGVTVAPRPGAQEEMDCTLDFCLDPEITDQLLVFRFTQGMTKAVMRAAIRAITALITGVRSVIEIILSFFLA